jgi:hypothetical protein
VIALLDPAGDRGPGFLHVAILCRPHFFFLQAAMKAFDVAVAFRVIIGRASMGDYQPIQSFDPARRLSGANYESGHFYFAQTGHSHFAAT